MFNTSMIKKNCKPVGSGVGAGVGSGVGAGVGSGVGASVGWEEFEYPFNIS